ncbi:hypothetical protein ABTL64_19745, partial [Acinetobacter baumannii]
LSAGELGLRPRLRLTPETASTDLQRKSAHVVHDRLEPFQAPAAGAVGAEPRRESSDWTWKDLLSGIDEPPIDDEVLAER